jgi:hypothetical protein
VTQGGELSTRYSCSEKNSSRHVEHLMRPLWGLESGLNSIRARVCGLRHAPSFFRDKCIRIAQSRFAQRATIGPSTFRRAVAANVRKPCHSHSAREGLAQFGKEMLWLQHLSSLQ